MARKCTCGNELDRRGLCATCVEEIQVAKFVGPYALARLVAAWRS